MAENKFAQIAKMFGLELEEVFHIKNTISPCKFTTEGLIFQNGLGAWVHGSLFQQKLLTGEIEVIMPPFRPQKGDLFWTYFYSDWVVATADWLGDPMDYARLEAGMVFRTQEEALAARANIYKKVTGKEYNSNDYR